MAKSLKIASKAEVRGIASGVLFMTFFATIWAYTGTMGFQGWGSPWLLVASLIVGIALFIGGVLLIVLSRNLSEQLASSENKKHGKRIGIGFNIIFAVEFLATVITIAVCNATSHTELIPIIIAIIVGLHFLPLAHLFRVRIYYLTGILLCLLPVMTWLFIPLHITLRGHQIEGYMSVVGFGSALILWGTSLVIFFTEKGFIGFVPNKWEDDIVD